ncbi:hypothetical protein TH8_10150 [Thalassospira profundimaris]|nr:hypothetical protein TH8_10150 [Thalassospira profundimaris]
MAGNRQLTIFSYDIRDDRRRRRIARLLEDQMVRVQYSLFEAPMTPDEVDLLRDAVEEELGADDSLRVYILTSDCVRRSFQVGGVPFPAEQGHFLF